MDDMIHWYEISLFEEADESPNKAWKLLIKYKQVGKEVCVNLLDYITTLKPSGTWYLLNLLDKLIIYILIHLAVA